MNKPNIWIATAIVMVIGTTFLGFQSAVAQYAGSSNLEEELKLAQEKVSNAGQQGAYGSGTSMLSADINETALFIIILVVIFGGVAGAFFAMSRSRSRHKEPAKY
jgi:hypothetical protein